MSDAIPINMMASPPSQSGAGSGGDGSPRANAKRKKAEPKRASTTANIPPPSYLSLEEANEKMDLLQVLASAARIQILDYLAGPENLSVTELTDRLDMSQPNVSHHLSKLKSIKAIRLVKDGKHRRYVLTDHGRDYRNFIREYLHN